MESTSASSSSSCSRNLLVCGSAGVGKTSLSLTLARGVFPPAECVPRRFDGWTISAHPAEFGLVGGAAAAPLKRTTSAAATSSNGGAHHHHHAKGFVSLTLWEDRPRPKVNSADEDDDGDEDDDDKEEEEEKENRIKREKEEDAVKRADAKQTRHVLNSTNSVASATSSASSASSSSHHHHLAPLASKGARHNILGGGRVRKEEEEAPPPPPPPCVPPRPVLHPKPHAVLLCFSSVNLDSFVEAETVLWPDLADRYPLAPVVLVALKCDLKDRDATTASVLSRMHEVAAGGVAGSSRSLCATTSSPASPIPEEEVPAGGYNDVHRSISSDINSSAVGAAVNLRDFGRSVSTDVATIGSQFSKQQAYRLGLGGHGGLSKDSESSAGTSAGSRDSVGNDDHDAKADSADNTGGKRSFMVTSDMGVAMAKRIGASAYIECSARDQKGLRPILQETLRALMENPALKATHSLPSSPLLEGASGGSAGKKSKKNSAPSFLFASGRIMRQSGSSVFSRSKAASLNFIRGAGGGDKSSKQ